MLLRTLAILALVSIPKHALATDVLDLETLGEKSFSAYVTGKTLTYSKNGQVFGVEEYLPDNHVRWSFNDGECQDGTWFAQNDEICFIYDGPTVPQCWSFSVGSNGLIAHYENAPTSDELYETARSSTPLYCKGPDVGV
ncbi:MULTISPECIES: hypothetical protein [Falsihalocynthiibacter]|uniref:hypothetical protein n=1 Tax=Falsihalocynthiibacter TaxID=2854182 RepID=UPI003002BC52